jgi:hypothetical protein
VRDDGGLPRSGMTCRRGVGRGSVGGGGSAGYQTGGRPVVHRHRPEGGCRSATSQAVTGGGLSRQAQMLP